MLLLGGDDIIVGRLLDRDGDVLLCVGEVIGTVRQSRGG